MVSVKTQYDPMFAPYQPEVIAKKPILQVKILNQKLGNKESIWN